MKKIIFYLLIIRKSKYYILSFFPKKIRFLFCSQLWFAYQLGLHQTIIKQSSLCFFNQAKSIVFLSKIKRFIVSEEEVEIFLNEILAKKRYKLKYKKVVLNEIVQYYPNLVLKLLIKHDRLLLNSYLLGLKYSIMARRLKLNFKLIQEFKCDEDKLEYPNKKFIKSNIEVKDAEKKLYLLNEILMAYNLKTISLKDSYTNSSFCVNNFFSKKNNFLIREEQQNYSKVTVLVTAFNAEETIYNCLNSLINQTWKNIEIIVINDASTDNTLDHIKLLCIKDKRLKLINLPYNVGTFAAKNIGIKYATGEYVTCQDADDWAHPQKIEEQVLPLIEDSKLIATTSLWLRIDKYGNYYARQYYPYLRHNPASPLFRREQIQKNIGLWHCVRTGADSEFFERLKLVFGDSKVLAVKKPLTFANHRDNSLMTSEKFGAYNKLSSLDRLDYWEAWRLWHIDLLEQKQSIYMPDIELQIDNNFNMFYVPSTIVVSPDKIKKCLKEHQVLF